VGCEVLLSKSRKLLKNAVEQSAKKDEGEKSALTVRMSRIYPKGFRKAGFAGKN